MNTLLTLIDWLLFLPLAFSVIYLLVFALASKRDAPARYPRHLPFLKFCVLFPAYKEDRVIVKAVRLFLQQNYPKKYYDLVVISDQMQASTNKTLSTLPIHLIEATYTESSKAKALQLALRYHPSEKYNAYLIMDADNLTSADFLLQMNEALGSGLKAVQAHRTALNTNTDIALLDAVSEEINNSIFRSGHIALGLSSALIGSGMAFEAQWFAQHVPQLQTAGEDKELEAMLLQERIHIGYLEHLLVEDEKTQSRKVIQHQRKRWLAAQFGSLWNTLPHLPRAIRDGNLDYIDKIIQWSLPPRIVLLAAICLFSLAATLISTSLCFKWWILLAALLAAFAFAIPIRLMNRRLLKAMLQVPRLSLLMAANLFKLRGVNKKFIHTQHGEAEN